MVMDRIRFRISSKQVLVVLLIFLGLLIIYQLTIADEPRRAHLTFQKDDVHGKRISADASGREELIVLVDLLEKSPTPKKPTKNLFEAPKPPKPKPKPRIVKPPPKPKPIPKPVKVGPTPEELALKELNQYQYVGMLERGGSKEVFITREDEQFTVKPGQQIKGTIYLKEIKENSAILVDQETGVEHTLP